MLANAMVAPSISVTDLDRAVKFYGETLGLPQADGPAGVPPMFQCGDGTMLLIYPREAPSVADHTLASFKVDDIESVVDGLSAKGVTFEQYDMGEIKTDERGIASEPQGPKAAWFNDPDGNILGIFQM
jgi:catechol 2,3-dioxygenase-like lactoylglutathione lyase family enzyme